MIDTIESLSAREILDSRGHPTVEATCYTAAGIVATASVPSGASTGAREARERRDGDAHRFGGRGVLEAVNGIVEEMNPALAGRPVSDQAGIDATLIALDGTDDKSRLGANAILGVSQAVARAASLSAGLPLYRYLGGIAATRLPVPCFNVLNGGEHAGWQGADFQEYMIVPHGAANVTEAVRWAAEIYHALKSTLAEAGVSTSVGDEGGFAPAVPSNRKPLDWLMAAIEATGLTPGDDVGLAFDAAASELVVDGGYRLASEDRTTTAAALIDDYEAIVADYPIVLIEDGLGEDDWAGAARLTQRLGDRITLVGDDIFVTQNRYIQRGIDEGAANAALIKLNQVGSVSETLAAARLAHRAGWLTMFSHRSGETLDDFIADAAVAASARYLKAGAPARGERLAKYNRLMAIEAELGTAAIFAGRVSG